MLLGRRTYATHAAEFEPMPPGNPFGDAMNDHLLHAFEASDRREPLLDDLTGLSALRRAAAELEGALLGHGREPAVLVEGQVDARDHPVLPAVRACVFF